MKFHFTVLYMSCVLIVLLNDISSSFSSFKKESVLPFFISSHKAVFIHLQIKNFFHVLFFRLEFYLSLTHNFGPIFFIPSIIPIPLFFVLKTYSL